MLVFTAFADTARYLYEHLDPWARKELKIHTGLVCGDGGNAASLGRTDYDDILTNFSPIAKRRADQSARFANQREEIDLLIATDCISEGQNLQDCDLLVNYDIHWNPVRIIQRFGRIDRIGSRNDSVQLVNFWPVADLDHYLGLKLRVEARMALVGPRRHRRPTTCSILSQLEDLIKEDLLFRDRQLKRLKDEILDLEDLDDSVSLTDFSLDEFRHRPAALSRSQPRRTRRGRRRTLRRRATQESNLFARAATWLRSSACVTAPPRGSQRTRLASPPIPPSSTRWRPTTSFTSTTTAPCASASPSLRNPCFSCAILPRANRPPSRSFAICSTSARRTAPT